MQDDSGEPRPPIHTICHNCGGSGVVNRPRLFLSLENGEPSTILEPRRCVYCRTDSGSLPGIVPPV